MIIKFYRKDKFLAGNPLTPMSDQDRISPIHYIIYNINQISDENKEKYQFRD